MPFGHDVLSVAEMEPSLPDETVLAMANQRDALLLTADKDVSELVFRQRLATVACSGPSRAHMARQEAPKAACDRTTDWAAYGPRGGVCISYAPG
jgi:Domain of unknown function (DUF5615)